MNTPVNNEIQWRYDLLEAIGGQVINYGIDPALLQYWRIYGGQQGIWVDKQRTAILTDDGRGLAVGLIHKGNIYPDDFDETGVIYHYPVTARPPARDIGEIEAVKNCHRLNVPLFVIKVSELASSKRDVYFGYVTMWDDRAKVFIIEFGTSDILAANQEERLFELKVLQPKGLYQATTRPGQAAFRIAVFCRYSPQCAVCEMAVIELLDAAHLVSKAEDGNDDPRNGLPLCALHHRAFDKCLFAIEPGGFAVETKRNGPDRYELGITKDALEYEMPPHPSALEYRWERWVRECGGE
ncbi:MAG: HNH endonuclease [Anaerolineae bacterium]|nr:HNH endonuclease [Anaerolineae bacterium]